LPVLPLKRINFEEIRLETPIKLPYGENSISCNLPSANVSRVLAARHFPGLKEEAFAMQTALENPIGCPSLKHCLHENDKVVVITTDNTRHCPDERILPVILGELESVIPRQNISIMIALGLHPPLNRQEMIKKLGREIVENYAVINHNPEQTIRLGVTSRGTPVEVNSLVAGADFRISTGFIEPHFFAGFSGGRKSLAPGVSSPNSIRRNHGFEMINHPKARAGILAGNPIHEDLVEQAKIAKLSFILNVLLNQEKQITHVFAGDPWLAHERGCAIEREIVQVEMDHRVDICIVSNGGAPLDLDFYQTCKGIDTASQITREGGIIIAASSCSQGLGPQSFISLHGSCGSPDEVLKTLRQTDYVGVGWQNQILARAQLKQSIYLLSNLDDSLVEQMKVTPIRSIEEGLERAFEVLGKDAEIAVIPQGPLILPVITKV
jgi:nickel-dependent lactate racemase